jgi:hypothetical protein
MAQNLKQIKDLESLDTEIANLRYRVQEIENRFDENFTDLKENYGSMAMNSIFRKRKKNQQSFWNGLTAGVLGSEKVQDGIAFLIDKLRGAFSRVVDRFFGK